MAAQSLQIFTDGSVRHQGPWAGAGLVFYDSTGREDGAIWRGFAISLGQEKSSRVAEKHAIRLALEFALENDDMADEFIIRSDCTNAMDDIEKHRRGRNGHHDVQAQRCADRMRALEQKGKRVSLAYVKAHALDDGSEPGCEGNLHADRLAGEASAAHAGLEKMVKEVWIYPNLVSSPPQLDPPTRSEAPWLAGHISDLY